MLLGNLDIDCTGGRINEIGRAVDECVGLQLGFELGAFQEKLAQVCPVRHRQKRVDDRHALGVASQEEPESINNLVSRDHYRSMSIRLPVPDFDLYSDDSTKSLT